MFDMTDSISNVLSGILVTNRIGHVIGSGEFAHGTIVENSKLAGRFGINNANTDLIALTASTNVIIRDNWFWLGSEEEANGDVPHSDCIQASRSGVVADNKWPGWWTIQRNHFNVSTNITPDAAGGHLQAIILEDMLGYAIIENNEFWFHDASESGNGCNIKNWRDPDFVLTIRNNTFATDGTWKYMLTLGGIAGTTNLVGTINATNNVFWTEAYQTGISSAPIYDHVITTGTYTNNWDYNYMSGWERFADNAEGNGDTTTILGSNSFTNDITATLFTDGSNGDLSLASGAVVIDQGFDLSDAFTDDILGNTRSGTWDIGAYEYSGTDTTPPAFSSASVANDGTTLTVVFGEATVVGSGGSGGMTISVDGGGAQTATYSSGSGTTSLVYTVPTVYSGETVTVSYTNPGDGLEDAAGNDVATISAESVTNSSTQTEAPAASGAGTLRAETVTIGAY